MEKLGLYIHIPFCKQKCHYCDFLSAPATKQVQKAYMDVLKEEICEKAALYKGYETDTVFIGGGTPTCVDAESLISMLEVVWDTFHPEKDCEISIECNPGTVTGEDLKKLKKAGINRLSIGLQSADDLLLRILGRIHTYEEFLQTYQNARKAGFSNINVDLMSSLPGQSLEQYEDTLHKVLALGPEHISAYSLIVEEKTAFKKWYEEGKLLLPDEETDRMMYYKTGEILKEAGYRRYEISNYAKKGYECRHNIRYWVRKPYLGLGLGASSFIENERFKNTDSLSEYLEKKEYERKEESIILSKNEEMEEFMFLGLRLMDGVGKAEFQKQFHCDMKEVYKDVIEKQKKAGLISENEERVYLTEKGIDVSNSVFSDFLLD